MRRETKAADFPVARQAEFMARLFAQEVPEVYEGVIEIKAAARDPGSRAKIAVISHDSSIDPVGACVGMRSARVQAVGRRKCKARRSTSFRGRRTRRRSSSTRCSRRKFPVVLDPEDARVEVVVGEAQLSLAIGRRGQNVRLAGQLTGWSIDIMTEAEESERRQKEFATRTELFVKALGGGRDVRPALASEGFETVEEIAYVDQMELASIEGLTTRSPTSCRRARKNIWTSLPAELEAKRVELGVEDAERALPASPRRCSSRWARRAKTLDDFAGLVGDDIRGYF